MSGGVVMQRKFCLLLSGGEREHVRGGGVCGFATDRGVGVVGLKSVSYPRYLGLSGPEKQKKSIDWNWSIDPRRKRGVFFDCLRYTCLHALSVFIR